MIINWLVICYLGWRWVSRVKEKVTKFALANIRLGSLHLISSITICTSSASLSYEILGHKVCTLSFCSIFLRNPNTFENTARQLSTVGINYNAIKFLLKCMLVFTKHIQEVKCHRWIFLMEMETANDKKRADGHKFVGRHKSSLWVNAHNCLCNRCWCSYAHLIYGPKSSIP